MKEQNSLKEILKMVLSIFAFNMFFLLILFANLRGGYDSTGYGLLPWVVAYICGYLVFSIIYGIWFVKKSNHMVVLCVIHNILSFLALVSFYSLFCGGTNFKNEYYFISLRISLFLTLVTLISSLITKFILKRKVY